jgi:ABC-type bacteriocin/lantibiotic exporter with double-glycine peptidase domain
MIELDNVSFTYRGGETDAVPALANIGLKIESGQFVAIIGQNGSGKSTLVKLLTAILYPTEGSIHIDGVPVEIGRASCRERVYVIV